MATVIGIFENYYLKNKPFPVVKPGIQRRKFTHIDDTINGCFVAWKKKKNRHYSLANNKSYKIVDVAKMFGNKIKYLKPRLGERYKSVVTNNIGNNKIYRLECKKSLKDYIIKFKKEKSR